MFEGQFQCGNAPFLFLDISQNYFSGSLPSCLNLQGVEHLHFDSNRFTGSIPESFSNMTNVLTLDMGNNKLSGSIPSFLGELSSLRILVLKKNDFTDSIPKQLCRLTCLGLIDLSINSLSGLIPNCLQNITDCGQLAFVLPTTVLNFGSIFVFYGSFLQTTFDIHGQDIIYEKQEKFSSLQKADVIATNLVFSITWVRFILQQYDRQNPKRTWISGSYSCGELVS